ncbi:SDR family NAD(P)-dependent oxidoreductase [Glutamicibacter nicotianae]
MNRMQDKVVLLTGIGSGMGRAAALRFAREGAKVIGCDLFDESSDETMKLARDEGLEIKSQGQVDLSDPAAAKRWVDWALSIYGHADVLYNNASTPRFGEIDELSIDDWNFTINNELNLVFYTVKAIWPYFKEHGGVVLNIGSIAGTRGVEFMSQNAHGTAKGGVISLTQQLAAEGGRYGIRAVCISPGFIVTPSTAWLVDSGPQPLLDNLARLPLGRPGRPEDIVNAALFLASEEAQWITGVNLVVDGGGTVLG